jgi:hypothetical protein
MSAAKVALGHNVETVWLNPLGAVHGKAIALQTCILLVKG